MNARRRGSSRWRALCTQRLRTAKTSGALGFMHNKSMCAALPWLERAAARALLGAAGVGGVVRSLAMGPLRALSCGPGLKVYDLRLRSHALVEKNVERRGSEDDPRAGSECCEF